MSAKSTWNLFPVRLFSFSLLLRNLSENVNTVICTWWIRKYIRISWPPKLQMRSVWEVLKFSVLVERTATITWESDGIARLKSLSETRNFIPSFCHSSISFPFFLDQKDFVNVIFPFNIFQYCKNIFTLVRRLYYFCPKLTYKKLGKFQFADNITKIKP